MNLKKLLAKGHLIPIYSIIQDDICLVGYRRKSTSRKANRRPFMLESPIPIAKVNNKETEQK